MTNPTHKKYALLLVPIVLLVGIYLANQLARQNKFGAGVPSQIRRDSIDSVGTEATPINLTSGYTGAGSASSSVMAVNGLSNFVFSGKYTPKSHGSIMHLLVERSLDGGSTYRPYNVIEVQSDEVLVHTSGTNGIPFTIPGSGTSVSGTAMEFDFDLTMVADYIKVSAKETTTSTAGTVYIRTNIHSN